MSDLLIDAAGPPFDEIAYIRMSLEGAKKAPLRVVLPQYDVKLLGIVENELIVRLGRKCSVEITWNKIGFSSRQTIVAAKRGHTLLGF